MDIPFEFITGSATSVEAAPFLDFKSLCPSQDLFDFYRHVNQSRQRDVYSFHSVTSRYAFERNPQFRWVLLPLILNGHKFNLNYQQISLGNTSRIEFAPRAIDDAPPDYRIVFAKLTNINNSAHCREALERLDQQFPEQKNLTLSARLSSSTLHQLRILAFQEQKTLFVCSNRITPTFIFEVLALLPALFPTLVEQNQYPLDMDLFYYLGKRDATNYQRVYNAWLTKHVQGWLTERRKEQLLQVFTASKAGSLAALAQGLQRLTQTIEQLERDWRTAIQQQTELSHRQFGLLHSTDLDYTDCVQYYIKHPGILSFFVNPDSPEHITFTLRSPVRHYNQEVFKVLLNSSRGALRQAPTAPAWEAVFLQQTHTLYFTADVTWNTRTNEVRARRREAWDTTEYGYPNPHLEHFNCWGDNKPYIVKALKNQDYITALEQTLAAVGGLTFSDSIVMNYVFDALQEGTNQNMICIQNNETQEWYSFKTLSDLLKKEAV